MKWLYYQLTAYFPRPLPTNESEYLKLKSILKDYYKVPDLPDAWIAISGHIGSTPQTKIRKSYGHLANAAKRLYINKLAQDQKQLAFEELKIQAEQVAKEGLNKLSIVDSGVDIECQSQDTSPSQ